MKTVEISLQAQIIDSELTAKLLGRGVAVSPVVTVEPRRRKFHKAITLSMPAPRPHTQGMTNQYSTSSAPTLRLLCSISGTIIFRLHLSCRSKRLLRIVQKVLMMMGNMVKILIRLDYSQQLLEICKVLRWSMACVLLLTIKLCLKQEVSVPKTR